MSQPNTDGGLGDPARLDALQRSGLLDAAPVPAFDRLTRLARRLLGVPVALVTLVEQRRQFLLSADGLPEPWLSRRETPISHSFCQHVVHTGTMMAVADADAEAVVRDNLARADLGVVAYLGMPLRSPDGYVLGALCAIDTEPRQWSGADAATLADLAEIAATEIALRDLASRLEARVEQEIEARSRIENELSQKSRLEALGEVAGGVAHDFANLLQSVQAGVRMAKKSLGGDPARAMQMLDLVADSAHRGTSITRRLLGFAWRGEARVVPVPPTAMLRDLEPMLRYMLADVGQQIRIDAADDLPPVMADRGELETVLINLVSNARDAMVEGGLVRVRAGVETNAPALHQGRYVALRVEDDGVGMTEETLARAAEAFFTTKPAGEGTGLGLSMARDFAIQAGGGFHVGSTRGVGTSVTLWLPAS